MNNTDLFLSSIWCACKPSRVLHLGNPCTGSVSSSQPRGVVHGQVSLGVISGSQQAFPRWRMPVRGLTSGLEPALVLLMPALAQMGKRYQTQCTLGSGSGRARWTGTARRHSEPGELGGQRGLRANTPSQGSSHLTPIKLFVK